MASTSAKLSPSWSKSSTCRSISSNEKKKTLQSKHTDYGLLGAKLLAFQGAADKLRLNTSLIKVPRQSAMTDILTATVPSTFAASGSYSIQVTQLARAHQITNKAATAVSLPPRDIVSGGSATFTFRVGDRDRPIVTRSATDATLEDLRTRHQ